MRQLEHLAKVMLIAFAALSLVVIIAAWVLKLVGDALPQVASLRNETIFVTTVGSAIIVPCVISWVWIQRSGLVRTAVAMFSATVISVPLLVGVAGVGVQQGVMTAVPENLSYDFLAEHASLQYTTWSTPATSTDVEDWRIALYGFPETFLHVCDGVTAAGGHYVMLDKFRLALDWLLALDVALIVVTAVLAAHWMRQGADKAANPLPAENVDSENHADE